MKLEPLRFLLNGVFASLIHFFVLWYCLKIAGFGSAGLSNLLASCVGIATSFFGNRYFVFKVEEGSILNQISKFVGLYLVIALIHGATSFILTDRFKVDYRVGFIVAVLIQTVFGYLGSKFLVFQIDAK